VCHANACPQIFSPEELLPAAAAKPDEDGNDCNDCDDLMNTTEEEALLMGHIEEIQKEKELLTSALPSLRRTNSDDDLLSTDDGSLDDVTMPQDEMENDGELLFKDILAMGVWSGPKFVILIPKY
jgi:hypothetical protein